MTERHAVIAPGGRYGPSAPLLFYPGFAAERRGVVLHPLDWEYPLDTPAHERVAWVHERVTPALDEAGDGALVIAKSLGTLSAPLAADRGLPAVWLTPLLTEEACVEGLRRATAPFLLVGGTADQLWVSDLARELTPHVLEVEGADHGMILPGPLRESAHVLGQVVEAVERFLDDVVWPGA